MIHASPSLASRQAPSAMGGVVSEINVEVMHILQNIMTTLKREMGLDNKDLRILMMAEKVSFLFRFLYCVSIFTFSIGLFLVWTLPNAQPSFTPRTTYFEAILALSRGQETQIGSLGSRLIIWLPDYQQVLCRHPPQQPQQQNIPSQQQQNQPPTNSYT